MLKENICLAHFLLLLRDQQIQLLLVLKKQKQDSKIMKLWQVLVKGSLKTYSNDRFIRHKLNSSKG